MICSGSGAGEIGRGPPGPENSASAAELTAQGCVRYGEPDVLAIAAPGFVRPLPVEQHSDALRSRLTHHAPLRVHRGRVERAALATHQQRQLFEEALRGRLHAVRLRLEAGGDAARPLPFVDRLAGKACGEDVQRP